MLDVAPLMQTIFRVVLSACQHQHHVKSCMCNELEVVGGCKGVDTIFIPGCLTAETRRCRSQAPRQVPWSKSSVLRPEAQVGPEGTMKVV